MEEKEQEDDRYFLTEPYGFNAYDTNIPFPRSEIRTMNDLVDEIDRLFYQLDWYRRNQGNRTPSGYLIEPNTLTNIQRAITQLQQHVRPVPRNLSAELQGNGFIPSMPHRFR